MTVIIRIFQTANHRLRSTEKSGQLLLREIGFSPKVINHLRNFGVESLSLHRQARLGVPVNVSSVQDLYCIAGTFSLTHDLIPDAYGALDLPHSATDPPGLYYSIIAIQASGPLLQGESPWTAGQLQILAHH